MKFLILCFHQSVANNEPELNSNCHRCQNSVWFEQERVFIRSLLAGDSQRERRINSFKGLFIKPALLIRCKVQYSASNFRICELNVPSCGNSCILQCSICPCILKAIPKSEGSMNPPFSRRLSLMVVRFCLVADVMYYFAVSMHVAVSTSLRSGSTSLRSGSPS